MSSDNRQFSVLLDGKLSPRWRKFKDDVGHIVLGQDRAVRGIIRSLSVLESGIQGPFPPNPLFFVGPPGSGKTYLAETIAKTWLGEAPEGQISPLVKISGENFTNAHEGSTLKGTSPGFVGYDDKSKIEDVGVFDRDKFLVPIREESAKILEEITEKYPGFKNIIKSIPVAEGIMNMSILEAIQYYMENSILPSIVNSFAPFRSVLLVDEFESMHPAIQKQFLGIFDDGKLEMLNGRVIDFRNCQIILTSNIATELVTKELDGGGLGFKMLDETGSKNQNQTIYELVRDEVKKRLNPAIYSRIGHDGIIVFHALSKEDYVRIIDIKIRDTEKRVQELGDGTFRMHATDAFREFLLSLADTPREGARQIKRIILKQVQEPLANLIERSEVRNGDELIFDMDDGKVSIRRKPHAGSSRKPIAVRIDSDKQNEARRDIRDRVKNLLDGYIREINDESGLSTHGKK